MSAQTFTTVNLTRDAAILVAKRRVRLMRQADSAVRNGNASEGQRLDQIAHQSELLLVSSGFPDFV